jgi:phage terminase large subunit-like protein
MLKTPSDHYWIFPYERGQYGNNVKNVIRDTARLDGAAYTILLEPGTSGGAAGLLYEEYKNNLTGYNTVQSLPKGTKADRATPLANAIYDGKVHICIRNDTQRQTLLDEFKSFPNGKHDDLVDAVAYGYNWLSKHGDNQVGTSGKRRRAKI